MDRGALTRYPGEEARFEIQISILGTREGARYVLIRCPTTVQPIDERDIKQTKGIPSVRVCNNASLRSCFFSQIQTCNCNWILLHVFFIIFEQVEITRYYFSSNEKNSYKNLYTLL